MNSGYYLGIDGGGTKSTAMLAFTHSAPPIRLTGGPMNLCSAPFPEVADNLRCLLRSVQESAGSAPCLGIGAGLAGFTHPQAPDFFRNLIAAWYPGVPMMLDTDAAAALYGAHGAPDGMILISGTGSVCYGMHRQNCCQVGGGGHLLDDAGSGYSIGRDILSSVLKSLDGRLPNTVLSELLARHGLSPNRGTLIGFAYAPTTGKDDIAALAPLLTEACASGDPIALSIAERAAGGLLELAAAAARRLLLPQGPLAFSGSILQKEPFVRRRLLEKLDNQLSTMVYYNAKADAASGAVRMARQAAGKDIL